MGKKNKTALFRWHYSDGTTIGCVQRRKTKYSRPLLLKSQSEIDKEEERLKKDADDRDIEIKVVKKILPVATVKYAANSDTSFETDCFRELVLMTQPTAPAAQRTSIAQLIGVILSSYLIRPVLQMNDLLDPRPAEASDVRALYASVTHCENAYFALRKIGEACILPMKLKDDFFKAKLPRIMPQAQEREILSCAWLKVRGCKDYKWPASYCDTAVILDQRYLKSKDMSSFYRMNPWCTTVFYGSNKKYPFGYQVSIKGDCLSSADLEWDAQKIQMLISTYVKNLPTFFSGKSELMENVWRQAGTYVAQHLKSHTSKKFALPERFRNYIMIFAWLCFLRVVKCAYHVPEAEMDEFRSQILNALLPGCSFLENKITAPAKSPQQMLEAVMQKLFTKDNLTHFFVIPEIKKPVWPEHQPDGTQIWGYLKKYDWTFDERHTDCVVVLRDSLLEIVKEVAPDLCGFSNVLVQVRKDLPVYLHSTPNVKAIFEGQDKAEQRMSLRLKIETLPIDDEIKQALRERRQ